MTENEFRLKLIRNHLTRPHDLLVGSTDKGYLVCMECGAEVRQFDNPRSNCVQWWARFHRLGGWELVNWRPGRECPWVTRMKENYNVTSEDLKELGL